MNSKGLFFFLGPAIAIINTCDGDFGPTADQHSSHWPGLANQQRRWGMRRPNPPRRAESRGPSWIPEASIVVQVPLQRQTFYFLSKDFSFNIFFVSCSMQIPSSCKWCTSLCLAIFCCYKHADAKEGWARNAVICNFVTKGSGDEALPEQQHIS